MLFAHLKRILRLTRLRLRGPNGANDEFLLAATAQNLGLGVLMGVAPGLTAIAMAATIATRWFTITLSGRPAHRPFRGLLSVSR